MMPRHIDVAAVLVILLCIAAFVVAVRLVLQ